MSLIHKTNEKNGSILIKQVETKTAARRHVIPNEHGCAKWGTPPRFRACFLGGMLCFVVPNYMKRFFLPKQVLQKILITASAVVFLFIIISFLSDRSFSQNLFSKKGIFVGTFDFSSSSQNILPNSVKAESVVAPVVKKPVVQNIKITTKTNMVDVTTASSSESPREDQSPRLYIKEIQAGDETSAKNEFVQICNYGNSTSSLENFSLKKKSSTGKEDGLLNKQWSENVIGIGKCFFVANADATIPIETVARWAKSYALAEKENALLLYYQNNLVDEVFWNQIPKGKSIIRESPTSSWQLSG